MPVAEMERDITFAHFDMINKLSGFLHHNTDGWRLFQNMLNVHLTPAEVKDVNNMGDACMKLMEKKIISFGHYDELIEIFNSIEHIKCVEIVNEFVKRIQEIKETNSCKTDASLCQPNQSTLSKSGVDTSLCQPNQSTSNNINARLTISHTQPYYPDPGPLYQAIMDIYNSGLQCILVLPASERLQSLKELNDEHERSLKLINEMVGNCQQSGLQPGLLTRGSLLLSFTYNSRQSLLKFWDMYISGELLDILQTGLITPHVLVQCQMKDIRLLVVVSEKEYREHLAVTETHGAEKHQLVKEGGSTAAIEPTSALVPESGVQTIGTEREELLMRIYEKRKLADKQQKLWDFCVFADYSSHLVTQTSETQLEQEFTDMFVHKATNWGYTRYFDVEREMALGMPILDNFFTAALNSTLTVLIVTKGYLRNDWFLTFCNIINSQRLKNSSSHSNVIILLVGVDRKDLPYTLISYPSVSFSKDPELWKSDSENWKQVQKIMERLYNRALMEQIGLMFVSRRLGSIDSTSESSYSLLAKDHVSDLGFELRKIGDEIEIQGHDVDKLVKRPDPYTYLMVFWRLLSEKQSLRNILYFFKVLILLQLNVRRHIAQPLYNVIFDIFLK